MRRAVLVEEDRHVGRDGVELPPSLGDARADLGVVLELERPQSLRELSVRVTVQHELRPRLPESLGDDRVRWWPGYPSCAANQSRSPAGNDRSVLTEIRVRKPPR